MRRTAIALALLAIAAAARAQDARASLPARLSAATRDTISRLVDSASIHRLPAELLIAKASEGVLKGADDARVLRAVRSLLRELRDARGALPPSAPASTLAAAASALHAGVSLDALRRLSDAHSGRADKADLDMALITLADLVANSVPPAIAASSVEELLRQGAAESEMAAFRAAVTRDIVAGLTPESAVAARTRALRRP